MWNTTDERDDVCHRGVAVCWRVKIAGTEGCKWVLAWTCRASICQAVRYTRWEKKKKKERTKARCRNRTPAKHTKIKNKHKITRTRMHVPYWTQQQRDRKLEGLFFILDFIYYNTNIRWHIPKETFSTHTRRQIHFLHENQRAQFFNYTLRKANARVRVVGVGGHKFQVLV